MSTTDSIRDLGARMAEFIKNRQTFPPEELEKYAGQWVAWAPDGRSIVAATPNPERLDDLVRGAGQDPALCVISYLPPEDGSLEGLHEA